MSLIESRSWKSAPTPESPEPTLLSVIDVLVREANKTTGVAFLTDVLLADAMGVDHERTWWSVRSWLNKARQKLRALGWIIEAGPEGTRYVAPRAWIGTPSQSVRGARSEWRAPPQNSAPPDFEANTAKSTSPPIITSADLRVTNRALRKNGRAQMSAHSLPENGLDCQQKTCLQHNLSSRTFDGKQATFCTATDAGTGGDAARQTSTNNGPAECSQERVIDNPNKPGGARHLEGGRAHDAAPPSDSPPSEQKEKKKRGRNFDMIQKAIEAIGHKGSVAYFLTSIEASRFSDRAIVYTLNYVKGLPNTRSPLGLAVSLLTRPAGRRQLVMARLLTREKRRASDFAWAHAISTAPPHRVSDADHAAFAKMRRRYFAYVKGGGDAQ